MTVNINSKILHTVVPSQEFIMYNQLKLQFNFPLTRMKKDKLRFFYMKRVHLHIANHVYFLILSLYSLPVYQYFCFYKTDLHHQQISGIVRGLNRGGIINITPHDINVEVDVILFRVTACCRLLRYELN